MRKAMSMKGVLAVAAALGGGLPPLHLRKRRKRKPDPAAEAAAAAKRARKAAKRAEDERRTVEGRASYTPPPKLGFRHTGWFTGWWVRIAQWDGAPYEMDWPRWRIRAHARRALPGAERPWWASNGRPGSWSRGRQNAYVRALPGAEAPS